MARASSIEPASGFSHSTCLPAATSASEIGRWRALPTTMLTASVDGSSGAAPRLDRALLGDALPARQCLLVAVAARRALRQGGVGVRDGRQPDRRKAGSEDRAGHPVGGGMAPAGHSGTDDRNGEWWLGHCWYLSPEKRGLKRFN